MSSLSVNQWITKANNDLKIANDEIIVENPVTDAICFHCQQCVEKYLKAFLCFNGESIPKIHDLTMLIKMCIKIDKSFDFLFSINVDKLTDYGVELRYPHEFYIPTFEEAREAIELAEKAKEFVLRKLVTEGNNGS